MTQNLETFDVTIVGGGPSGATVAHDLAEKGYRVALLDKAGRIKPCGGAVPPRLIRDFKIPDELIVAKVNTARVIAPSEKSVDMHIDGYVGMVDRCSFDEWLRVRAANSGAERKTGQFLKIERDGHADGVIVAYAAKDAAENAEPHRLRTKVVIGADGARSEVARQEVSFGYRTPCVFAYHEILKAPEPESAAIYDSKRCDVYYQGWFSPDFYAWVFPHGDTMSVGTGTAHKGFSLRQSVGRLRKATGLDHLETIRREGAPIPLKPLKRWDNGRDVVLIGDAAGIVAPASGEGIYYAMASARMTGEAVETFLKTGDARALKSARKVFMKQHGRVFFILGLLQKFWYTTDKRREQFVKICNDPDVQKMTWDSYMNKEIVRTSPMTHVRILVKDVAHLMGFAKA